MSSRAGAFADMPEWAARVRWGLISTVCLADNLAVQSGPCRDCNPVGLPPGTDNSGRHGPGLW